MQPQDHRHVTVQCGRVVDKAKIAERVQEAQRVDRPRAERVELVSTFEVLPGPRHLVVAQQVDAELLVGGGQPRFDIDSLLVQVDRVAVASRNHVEMSRHGIDTAVVRVEVQGLFGPVTIIAVQQVGGRAQRVKVERRPAGSCDQFVGLFQRRRGCAVIAAFQRHPGDE